MEGEIEIREKQVWERRGSRGKRRATAQVDVERVIRDSDGEIVEVVLNYAFTSGTFEARQGRISPAGLRRRYRLVAEQESLV